MERSCRTRGRAHCRWARPRDGKGFSPTSSPPSRMRTPRCGSGIDSRKCWSRCPGGPPWFTPPTAPPHFGDADLPADLVRPGIFLYGGEAGQPDPRPVAALRARVVAVRSIAAGDTVGYGAHLAGRRGPGIIATLWRSAMPTVFPDPRPRMCRLSRRDRAERQAGPGGGAGHHGHVHGCWSSPSVAVGDVATIFGGLVSLDRQAEAAGTISYELLTRLGPRVARRYERSS